MKKTGRMCELCGKRTEFVKRIVIEGSELWVCAECSRFGGKGGDVERVTPAPGISVTDRLERRRMRARERDIYEQIREELVPDYPMRIRNAREAKGWNRETLAKRINEKKSVIAKLETGDMAPEETLTKKLEQALGITLKEAPQEVPSPKAEVRRGLTLGDFIKKEGD